MQEERPPSSLTAAVPAGRIIARLSATLRQTEQACAEVSSIEGLLCSLSAGVEDLTRTSAMSVDTRTTKSSLERRNADELTMEVHVPPQPTDGSSPYNWVDRRTLCSALEGSNVFHRSGLSTTFSALERSVSNAMAFELFPKLQRVTDKVRQLCSIVDERAQKAQQRQSLPHARAEWMCEAVRALHRIAHASLESEDAEATKPSVTAPCIPPPSPQQAMGIVQKSHVFPTPSDAIWWELYAGLQGVLHRTALSSASTALGKSEEVAESRLELQRQRLLSLLEEMTMWLVEDTSATR
ncbi:hypothetical protein LPMP_355620 [Leishmania panamensis]|uniref:Uncharacterized protein n=1 Tax=Leishmania panamensis TaxID=5679 RepID=A0A088S2V3_LEIPA|nr:hypothetical protein LPMP_355620 [Leishmania panamensis]AIO02693.1 hypothetical protein LPMP_355620 [Leishmania panamensis]